MSDDRQRLGQLGEEQAARFLRSRGYRIRHRNYRCRWGEIDLVAEHRGDLVFVEVKTRRGQFPTRPSDNVTGAKQRKLSRLADHYLADQRVGDRNCRFDIVEVYLSDRGKVERIEIIEDAFEYVP